MNPYKATRLVCAIVLMATFFLPLSRCYYVKPTGDLQRSAITSNATDVFERQYQDNFAYRKFQADELQGWMLLIAFCWPLLLAVTLVIRPGLRGVLLPAEPIACMGSAIMLAGLLDADRILWGGYLAISALSIYFFTASLELWRQGREQFFQRLRSPPS